MTILAPPFSSCKSLGRSFDLSEPQSLMGTLDPQSQGGGQTRQQVLQPLSLLPHLYVCSPLSTAPTHCTSQHRHPTCEVLLASTLGSLPPLSWLQSAFR